MLPFYNASAVRVEKGDADRQDGRLKIVYDYRTDFNNNVELDLETAEMNIDRVSQAAPLKIQDIELQQVGRDEFNVFYTIRNTGGSQSEVEIEDLEFQFGDQRFTDGSCEIFKREGSNLEPTFYSQLSFSERDRELVLSCPLDTSNYDSQGTITTKTSGEINYIYTIKEEGDISLPDGRSVEQR